MRVLVVDDSTIFRKVVRDALADLPQVEIVGVAANGRVALEKIDQLRPDLLTLDVEMPELNGIEVLEQLQSRESPPAAIMLSSLTEAGAAMTTKALGLGAFDFVLKPSGSSLADNARQLRRDLLPRVQEFRSSLHRVASNPGQTDPRSNERGSLLSPRVVLMGVSTGGPAALHQILPTIPASFPLPIMIVQHMPAVFTRKLAEALDKDCPLHVQEIEDEMIIRPGQVYIAPGGKQARLESGIPFPCFKVTDDPPVNHCKPSIDLLFHDAANVYGGRAVAVVLTGMGNDGTDGCRVLQSKGATIIAQDAATSVVYGMPRSIVEAGLATYVLPLDKIFSAVEATVMGQPSCV